MIVVEVVGELSQRSLHRDCEGRVLRYTDASERHRAPSVAMVPAEPELAASAEAWEAHQSETETFPPHTPRNV